MFVEKQRELPQLVQVHRVDGFGGIYGLPMEDMIPALHSRIIQTCTASLEADSSLDFSKLTLGCPPDSFLLGWPVKPDGPYMLGHWKNPDRNRYLPGGLVLEMLFEREGTEPPYHLHLISKEDEERRESERDWQTFKGWMGVKSKTKTE